MNLPDFLYSEELAPLISGFIIINSFLFVFTFMPLGTRRLCVSILFMEICIISSVALWHYYSILYFFLIWIFYVFITYPKVWNYIENKLNFKL